MSLASSIANKDRKSGDSRYEESAVSGKIVRTSTLTAQTVRTSNQTYRGSEMDRDSAPMTRRHAQNARSSARGSQLVRDEKRALHERLYYDGHLSQVVPQMMMNREKNRPKSRFMLPQHIKADLQNAFRVFDLKGDGVLKSDDLRIAIRCLGFEPKLKDIDFLFDLVGQKDSRTLSLSDFEYVMTRTMTIKDNDDELRNAFKLLSMEANGKVNLEKLKEVNKLVGESLTDEELKEMIDYADMNKTGTVTEDEFCDFCGETVLWESKCQQ